MGSSLVNLHFISIPKNADSFISFFLLRVFYLPLAILFFINVYHSIKISLKGLSLIGGSIVLFAGEWLAEQAGIFEYLDWKPVFSPFFWFSFLCVSFVFYRFADSGFLKRGGEHA
jgi:hypothetical protein